LLKITKSETILEEDTYIGYLKIDEIARHSALKKNCCSQGQI
jgi:hypothetical protein